MKTGVVNWFDEKKGYGFISPDDEGHDIFVHHTDIVMPGFRTLAADQRVQFEVEQAQKGLKAVKVTPIS